MRKHRFKIKAIKRVIMSFTVFCLSMLIVLTSMTVGVSANNDEVYFNDDMSVVIKVDRTQDSESKELMLDFTVSNDNNVTVEDIQIQGQSIKNDDFLYSHAVGENGNYKFSVITTRIEKIENENNELEEIVRQETFIFTVSVNDLEEIKEEIKEEPQIQVDNTVDTDVSEEQLDPSELIETGKDTNVSPVPQESVDTGTEVVDEKEHIPDENGLRILDKIPSMEELEELLAPDEYVHVDNETGLITIQKFKENDHIRVKRSSDVVTTGRKVVAPGNTVTVTWRENPSYYWQMWGGISELFVNGNRAYCWEPAIMDVVATAGASGVSIDNIRDVKVHPDGRLAFTPSHAQKKNIELIANYGYKYPGHQTIDYEWATKKLIWIELGWDVSGGQNVDAEMAEIRSLIAQHNDVPTWDGDLRQTKIGEVIDLSERGLNKFTVNTRLTSGLEIVEDSGDTLKIRITEKNATLALTKKGGSEKGTSYIYSDGDSQKAAHLRLSDPVDTIIDFEVKSHMQRVYKTGENGEPLANHKFRMSYSNAVDANGLLLNGWDYVTGANGYTPYDEWNREGATVYVQEIEAKAPYIRNTEIKTFTVTSGAETTINFTNVKAQGQFSIGKFDNHGKRAIATFNILNASNTIVGTITTSLTDNVLSDILPLGSYKLQEVSVNGNLVLNPEIINVELKYKDQVTPIVLLSKDFVNNYQRSDITITKVEDNSDRFNPENHGKKLAGVEIGLYAAADTYEGSTLIYRKGELIGKEVTNSLGQVTYHNVAIGEYNAKELKTIEGYQLFDGVWNISVKFDGTKPTVEIIEIGKTVTNTPIYSGVELVKANATATERLEGAEFELYYKDKLLGTYTSDKDGRIVVEGLRHSTGNAYKFVETKSPWGYWLSEDPIYFDITTQGEMVYLIAPNNLIEVHIEGNKTNEETNPLEGVGFSIRNFETKEIVILKYADGREIKEESVFYTDENGDFFTRGMLTAGEYELIEVDPHEGYQPIDPIRFTVDADQSYIDLGDLIGLSLDVGDIVNYWNRGDIEIGKLDPELNIYLPNFGFNLYDINNNLLGYFETDETGFVTIPNLKRGLYDVEEVKVNGEYLLNPNQIRERIFVEEHETTYTVIFENVQPKGRLEGLKLDYKDAAGVEGAEYGLFTLEDELVLSTFTDKEGKFVFEGFSLNKYYVQEIATVDGYRLDETKYYVDFEYVDEHTPIILQTLTIQEVREPVIQTEASFVERDKDEPNMVTVKDKVSYENAIIGKEYESIATLMNPDTGLPYLIDGKPITGSVKFIADKIDGFVEVYVTYDENLLKIKKTVFFEEFFEDGIKVAIHADINDIKQTVEIPEGKTQASFDERDKNKPNIVTLQDETFFTGLVVGQEYTIKTVLRDRYTGKPIIIDGIEISVQNTFIPTSSSDSVITSVTFDQNKLMTDSVNFAETVYDAEGRLVFMHDDLEDEHQTLNIITYRILKKDATTKAALPGAGFTYFNESGEAVMEIFSNEDGVAEFKLFYGEKGTILETTVPEGYLKSDEVIEVDTTVHEDGTLFEIEFFNELMPIHYLPETGVADATLVGGFSSLLIALGSLISLFAFKRRKEEDEDNDKRIDEEKSVHEIVVDNFNQVHKTDDGIAIYIDEASSSLVEIAMEDILSVEKESSNILVVTHLSHDEFIELWLMMTNDVLYDLVYEYFTQ